MLSCETATVTASPTASLHSASTRACPSSDAGHPSGRTAGPNCTFTGFIWVDAGGFYLDGGELDGGPFVFDGGYFCDASGLTDGGPIFANGYGNPTYDA